jgi:predicted CoA-substrate-specific enzyme activase
MIYAGIDVGSRTIKVVLFDGDERSVIGSGVANQGVEQEALTSRLLDSVLDEANTSRNDIARIVATGYGRDAIALADTTVTEITCHARGVHHLAPDTRTIIDIGGQDSKLIRLEADGLVRDFVMNDRCAAGTGRFLEVVAERLDSQLNDLGKLASHAQQPAPISSMCVVFAETEIIGLLASKESPENIVAGVQSAIASRITSMAGRSVEEPIVLTGGVAMIPGMDTALADSIGKPVTISTYPQLTGALGAALIASK